MISLFNTYIHPEAKRLVNEVMDSTFLNQGKMVDNFETELKRIFNINHLLTVNSCSSALHIALTLLNVKDKEVILPAQTFVATGLAILMAGGIPVFADVDENGNIDPVDANKRVTDRTAAFLAVSWGGIPPKSEMLVGAPVIEDLAHALGSTRMGRPVGNDAFASCFSFQSIKMLTTADGGAISVKNFPNIEKINRMRWFGINKSKIRTTTEVERDVNVSELGFKFHMNDYNAAMGLGNLTNILDRIERRRKIAARYLSELNLDGILLPNIEDVNPSWWLFTIKVKDRLSFINKLKSNNIQSGKVDGRIDKNIIFGGQRELEVQAWFDDHQINIPCHDGLTDEDVELVINTIKSGW